MPQNRLEMTELMVEYGSKVGNETVRRESFCEKKSARQHIMIFLATFLKRIKKFG